MTGINFARLFSIGLLALAAFLIASFLGCQTPKPNDPAAVPRADTKRIALTYDDAPLGQGPIFSGQQRTDAFIAQLRKSRSGPVTIFVTTQGMDDADGAARVTAYADAGHLIANHSDTHPWGSRLPIDDYIADIDTAELKLKGLPNRRPWYRFPYLDEGGYGDANQDKARRDIYRTALAERGLMSGYVTIDTYDWHLDSLWRKAERAGETADMDALSKVYVNMVLDAANHYDAMSQDVLGRRAAQVLLLHENDLAASFTSAMIDALRNDGWEIISADEAYKDEIADYAPETLFSGMGRIAAIARDQGKSGTEFFDHWSASEAGIEARTQTENVFKTGR